MSIKIHPSKIETGDLLFLSGTNKIAKGIKKAQKDMKFINWDKNHVGWYINMSESTTDDSILCTGEEDYPGVFDINIFSKEYNDKKVYVCKMPKLSDKSKFALLKYSLTKASDDRLTNYAYLDILSFKINSLSVKLFNKDLWIGRKRNKKDRHTCSQISCQFVQIYYELMTDINHIECYPAQIADYMEQIGLKIYEVEHNS